MAVVVQVSGGSGGPAKGIGREGRGSVVEGLVCGQLWARVQIDCAKHWFPELVKPSELARMFACSMLS